MSSWLLVALLGLQAHFAASYLVPLDTQGQGAFGGLLRWFWPWAYGDRGLLGQITSGSGFPIAGFFLAATTFLFFLHGALAAAGIWVPSTWWRALATIGAPPAVSHGVVLRTHQADPDRIRACDPVLRHQ